MAEGTIVIYTDGGCDGNGNKIVKAASGRLQRSRGSAGPVGSEPWSDVQELRRRARAARALHVAKHLASHLRENGVAAFSLAGTKIKYVCSLAEVLPVSKV